MSNRFVVLSGCSGGGKSTLLEELRRRGYHVIVEPGRRIVQAELAAEGNALPWLDLEAFARKAIQVDSHDLKIAATLPGWVFFDRGLIDASVALNHIANQPLLSELGDRYHGTVFLTPPWKEIFAADAERQHDFAAAVLEFERLEHAYQHLGYRVILLPREDVHARADRVLAELQKIDH